MWPFKKQVQVGSNTPVFVNPRFSIRYDMDRGYYIGSGYLYETEYFETEWELIESVYLKGAKAHYQYLINKRLNP